MGCLVLYHPVTVKTRYYLGIFPEELNTTRTIPVATADFQAENQTLYLLNTKQEYQKFNHVV
jgi:hypothetical protein